MIAPTDHKRARYISVIAATVIALACGTNYVYSAWAPQFAQRLKLSSTESNLIGTFGNLGMYATGIPSGMMVDKKTPRWGVALGTACFVVGYYPIAQAYKNGQGSMSVGLLCLFSFFTGAGSCSAFTASIKAAALNFPQSRGTATAFPLAAFGLSAFFFATIAQAFPHSTYNFLILLATGTVALPVISFFFIRIFPNPSYKSVSQHERQAMHRRKSSDGGNHEEPGAQQNISSNDAQKDDDRDDQEDTSLLSTSSGEDFEQSKTVDADKDDSHHLDVRGFALLPLPEFWQLFGMLGLGCGIGLMTINNIGNDAQALWKHYDDKTDPHFIEQRQQLHVSIISFCSFTGRLLSGVGSDLLVSKLGRSRFWCLFMSASIFLAANLIATSLENPNLLVLVSGLTGLAYGFLFGVYPSLVSHAFGVHGLSQNWGTMTLAPVITGNIFNLLYGRVYDSNSIVEPNGDRECVKGVACYATAYWVTSAAAALSIGVCLWSIYHENEVHKRKEKDRRRSDHERLA